MPSISGGKREENVVWVDHCSLTSMGLENLTFFSLSTLSQEHIVDRLQMQEEDEEIRCGMREMKACLVGIGTMGGRY